MKLNPDCIRDILITVESNTGFQSSMVFNSSSEFDTLASYPTDEVLYHIKQCEYSELLTRVTWYNHGCLILDLSPAGHEFLANIRSDTNWNKTKDIAKTIGSTSLSVLSQIASNVVSELLKKYC